VGETRLHSHDTLRGSGYDVDKTSCYLLRNYVCQSLEFVVVVVHGPTLYFRTITSICCSISNTHSLPRHFIFRHKQNINVFKMFSVKCKEIWQFDIRMSSIKTNQETVNWIYVAYSQVL
jgi:hypothetical protein